MPHLDVVNPYDLAPIGTVGLCDWDRIDGYLDSACQLFKNKESWLPAHKRIDVLKKTAGIMASRSAELAFLIANEGGKPLVDARVEVARAIDGIDLCIKELLHHVGQEVPMGLTSASESRLAFSTREPLGIVVAVSAFNHPLNLIVHQVAPAVATGCPVLVKPADDTPLSCQLFVQILHEAGLPEEWCRYCPCELDTAQRLVVDPRIGFFSFVGSAKVGWMLRSKLAAGVRCSLEHGGAAPVIIDRDYDLAKILPKLVKGGYYHSGQVCVSVQRVYVPRDRLEEIASPLSAMVAALKVDNAIHAHTDCGPLIRPREVDRVAQWVSEAQQQGATLLTGGERLSNTSYAPTLLLNPASNAKVSREEIFGPVVCLYGYDEEAEAITAANSLPFAFQASVFSNRLDFSMRVAKALDASAVMVNDHTAFRVDWMPFAGRRQSGLGVGGIGHSMQDMSQHKMIVMPY